MKRTIGQGGNDSIDGGAENNTISGREGRNFIRGDVTAAVGDDSLPGDADCDTLLGDAGSDTLRTANSEPLVRALVP